ncbi:hypothetical protein AVEN_82805-1 [Araneus ventricosus]|uniref:Uncharacterized protein n=1 Tax=Araneus ventricosus TaxID=182803 RepID=A0A4Y2DBP5_ARAVE|nr:hypothetical protein AVEN_82805-1 [Araneus ventricosus]
MFFVSCTQRIIKYLLLSILFFSLQCLATDDTDESPEEDKEYLDNDFFHFTTRKGFFWDGWTVATHKPSPTYDDGGYSGGGDPTIFFIILGVGIVIFIGLLFLCKKARDQMPNPGSRSVPGIVTHPPTAGAGGIDVTISSIGSASDPTQGRPGIFRQTSEKPPDYATVTIGDLSNPKSPFPSVMRQKSSETPPPKYDENNPMFK